VDFRVLGPVEARAEGRPLALAGARQRALLAVLLLRAGEPVARERVIADLWGERPPDGAVKTVQAVVSRLRRALGGEAARLVSSAAGYRLRVEPDELDLGRFERLCADGRRALAAGHHERAAARLRAALAEWRGPPLADVALEPFAPPEVARLEDLRAAAVEDRVEADLAMGRGAELVGELEGLVAAERLRERLRGQLMLALYRAGRQGEALDECRDVARALDSELGLRPGPELERLQQAILAHDPALLRASAGEEPRELDRRRATATILVAELAGWARVGDADADGVRAAHDRRLRDALAAHGASPVKAVGDALVAAFASAGAAIACAVEMHRAFDREARRGALALELRVGVAAGDVAWAGEDYSGTPVIEAQRLCAAASAGSILVADAVRLLAGPGTEAELADAGELEAAHARARASVVLYGRCDDGLSAPAQPFAQALGAYIAACPIDELRVEMGARASDLVQLLPELAARLPGGVAEPAPAEPEIQRLRTLEAATALLNAAGEAAPVLLVLDDLHWADDLSLLALRHPLSADVAARLLVVATYRDTEPGRSRLLGEVVTGLARRPDVARLQLGPLRERDIAAILANAGRESSQAGGVRRATAGNPFFVGEIVRALEHGHDPGAALTPRVRDVVRWRLGRLPERTVDALAVAAVVGAEFDADVLVQGIVPEEIITAVHARRAPMMSATAGLRL
jgi:DNA-binding SARP family transcriptional activator